jgi:hypothetical protein
MPESYSFQPDAEPNRDRPFDQDKDLGYSSPKISTPDSGQELYDQDKDLKWNPEAQARAMEDMRLAAAWAVFNAQERAASSPYAKLANKLVERTPALTTAAVGLHLVGAQKGALGVYTVSTLASAIRRTYGLGNE